MNTDAIGIALIVLAALGVIGLLVVARREDAMGAFAVAAAALGAAAATGGMLLTGSRDPWSWALAVGVVTLATPVHLRYLLVPERRDG